MDGGAFYWDADGLKKKKKLKKNYVPQQDRGLGGEGVIPEALGL